MLLLFLGACLGHLVLMTTSHNWWYAQRLPHRTGNLIHFGHAALILAFPAYLWHAWGWDLAGLFAFPSGPAWPPTWQEALAAYVVLCAVAGFVLLPANTVRRLLRPDPGTDTRTEAIDVAREMGYRPLGKNRKAFMTMLPGNEVFQVELVERTLRLPRLPAAWDGLTVLHLSDLHLNGTPDRDWFRWIMDRCAAWEPDLVALTGDVADSFHHMRWIVPVLGRLRWRLAAFAILGNHDHWYDPPLIRRRLRRLGMRVLTNSWEQLEVRGEPLVAIGHEGPWLRPAPDLKACPRDPFRLCLSHTPDNIRWARRNEIDLMLSGHVHGGQVRFPLFGSVLVPSAYGRWYDCGTFAEGPTLLHVTRGLSGEHPLRYRCRPEVVLLTLRPAEGPAAVEMRRNAEAAIAGQIPQEPSRR
jgi:predicted MPP superfamily phosphohydrolase